MPRDRGARSEVPAGHDPVLVDEVVRFVAGGPRLPLSETRTLMVKYTYTFIG